MRSSSREEIVEVFDALEADFERALGLSFDALTTPERLAMLERCAAGAVAFKARFPGPERPVGAHRQRRQVPPVSLVCSPGALRR